MSDFTLIVKAKNKQEKFGFGDLVFSHAECKGGHVTQKYSTSSVKWELECQRCGVQCRIRADNEGTVLVINTAIDGKERKIYGGYTVIRGE